MVDRSIVIDGLIGDGEILDLTADEALAWGFADHLAADQNEVLQIMGWADAHIVHVRQSFQFRIAQFLTGAEIATLLLSFGMLGLVVELFTPGFGAPGFVGIGCLVLYFGGNLLTGAANYWGALLFVVGIILLAIEIIVPGFGIWGISGLTALVVGIILAAPNPTQGMGTLLIASAVTLIAIPVFFRIFGKTHFMQRFVLKTAETVNQGYTHAADKSHLLGQTGRTLTVLRPSGSILIDGMRIDALADGTFIPSGVSVKVIRVEGAKVVVSVDRSPTG
jgi:membrane-bound serine protease (ClpP class)